MRVYIYTETRACACLLHYTIFGEYILYHIASYYIALHYMTVHYNMYIYYYVTNIYTYVFKFTYLYIYTYVCTCAACQCGDNWLFLVQQIYNGGQTEFGEVLYPNNTIQGTLFLSIGDSISRHQRQAAEAYNSFRAAGF